MDLGTSPVHLPIADLEMELHFLLQHGMQAIFPLLFDLGFLGDYQSLDLCGHQTCGPLHPPFRQYQAAYKPISNLSTDMDLITKPLQNC